MSDDPGPEPTSGEDAGGTLPLGEFPDPDEREVLSDGSGGVLVEPSGGDAGGPDDGSRRILAEKSIDEVFERFEEDSPEEVIATGDEPDPGSDGKMISGDVDRLFGDLPPAPDPDDGRRTGAAGSADEDLFDDRDGHRRVVGESSVDEMFERFVENDPEEVIEAHDPALASPTEAELRSLGRSDGPLGELPDPPDDARSPVDPRGPDGLERTGEDVHRSVGDSDVDAAFEEFEEDSVEEVIDVADVDPEDDDLVQTEIDESVETFFGDISDVDLETRPVPEEDDGGPAPPPSPEETAAAIEGLLTDLPDVDPGAGTAPSKPPSPQETADAIEGLLADLSTVEDGAGTPMTDETAEASGPEFGPGEARGKPDPAGEDVTTGVAVNRTPADGVVDVSATDLFCAFDGDGPLDLPEELRVAGGWERTTGPPADGSTAAATFDALRDRVAEVPSTTVPAPADAPSTTGEGTSTGPGSADGDTGTREPIPEFDLESPDTATDAGIDPSSDPPAASGPGSTTTDNEHTGTMAETGDRDTTTDVSPTDGETTSDGERAATPDVEGLFADYEEDTPEEVVARADAATDRDEPDDAIVGDVEGLFGDLSNVDLDPGTDESGPATADDGPDRAPDSEAAVAEIEEMFSDLESVDVDPAPSGEDRAGSSRPADRAETAGAGTPFDVDVDPQQSGADRIAEDRDVDGVFEEFEEDTVDEVIQVDDEPTGTGRRSGPAAEPDDEPAEVETGDFMKELAAGKDPEEIGITVYDGSRTGDGTAIAGGGSDRTDGTGSSGSPSIESPPSDDARPSIERPTKTDRGRDDGSGGAPSIEDPSTASANAGDDAGSGRPGGAPSIEEPSTPSGRTDGESASGRSGGGTASGRSDDRGSGGSAGEESSGRGDSTGNDRDGGVSATDLFDEMGGREDAAARSTGAGDPDPGPATDGTRSGTNRETDPGTDPAGDAGRERGSRDGDAPAGRSRRRSGDDQFTASGSGPGSETLFPAEGNDAEGDDAEETDGDDPEDGTVLEALELLVARVGRRLRDLF